MARATGGDLVVRVLKELEGLREDSREHSRRLDLLDLQMSRVSQRGAGLAERVSELAGQTRKLADQVKTFSDQVRTFSDQVQTFSDQVQTFSDQVQTNSNRVGTLSSEMDAFCEDMGVMADQMHQLATHGRATDARVVRLVRAVSQLAERSTDRFEEIEARILALESKR